jgi:mRNA interferase YafQ
MFQPVFTKRFEKDIKLCQRRNCDMTLFKDVVKTLIEGNSLVEKHNDHKLSGKFVNHRECHIQPDWLLIYSYKPNQNQIIFERTGTHSDLYK